jgi:predicted dehydrogenase
MKVRKIGVLGCGMIAEQGHMPALKQIHGLTLHAVYDIAWNRALAMQAKFQIWHAFLTEKAFWESDIDAVVICTPAPFHLANVTQAAAHGKHVLCEKPLAMEENDILQMKKTMDAADRQLFTVFTYRFGPVAVEIHRLIRSGAIGEVRALRLNYLWNLHGKWNENGERRTDLQSSASWPDAERRADGGLWSSSDRSCALVAGGRSRMAARHRDLDR